MRAGQGTQGPAVASEGPRTPQGSPGLWGRGMPGKVGLELRLHWRIFSLEGWWNSHPPGVAPRCRVGVETWAGSPVG